MSKERFLIAGLLTPVNKGQTFDKIPAHVTLLPWVNVERARHEDFGARLLLAINQHSPLTLVGEEKAFFGPNNDIAVRNLSKTALELVHQDVLRVAADFDPAILENPWVGNNYAPHVTYVNGQGIEQAEKKCISELQVIGKKEGLPTKTVRFVCPLKGGSPDVQTTLR